MSDSSPKPATSSASASDDESRRKLLKPAPMETTEILSVLCEQFSSLSHLASPPASFRLIRELDSYDDRNFLVELSDDDNDGSGVDDLTKRRRFVLKIHNGVETDHVGPIELQNDVVQYVLEGLAKAGGGVLKVPVPVHNDRRELITFVPDLAVVGPPGGGERGVEQRRTLAVRLMTYLEGETMSEAGPVPDETLADLGICAGRLDRVLDDYVLPSSPPSPGRQSARDAAHRTHAWDLRHFPATVRGYLPHLADPARRALATAVADACASPAFVAASAAFRRGLIHNDLNDANVLISSEGPRGRRRDRASVAGIIDFGDMVHTWRVLEASTAMAYAAMSRPEDHGTFRVAAVLLRGYCASHPLLPEEVDALYLLVCARMALSATVGYYSYSQNPENEYLLLHAEPAWKTLEMWWKAGGEEPTELFRGAAEGGGWWGERRSINERP